MTVPRPNLIDSLLVLLGLSVWVGKGLDVGPVTVRPVDVVGILVLVALLTRSAFRPSSVRSARGIASVLGALLLGSILLIVAAAAVSVIAAEEPTAVVRFIARYVLGAVLIVGLLTFMTTHARIRVLTYALLAGAVISVAFSAVGLLLPPLVAFTVRYGDRAQAFLNHPNQLAMLLVSVIPIALAFALRRPKRIGAWLVLAVLVAGVGLSGSKVNLVLSVVALAITSLLAAQLHRRLTRRIGIALGLTLGTLTLAFLAYLTVDTVSPRTLETIERLLQEPEQVTAVITRVEMWGTAVQLGMQNPWTGIGAANAIHYIPYDHAHNVFIEFFMTLGVPGLSALTLMLFTIFALGCASVWSALTSRFAALGARLLAVALPVGALGYVLANLSSDSFGGTTLPVLWVVVALLICQLKLMQRPAPASTREGTSSSLLRPAP